ncbi:NAD(P)H-dependent oxidoreductase [Leisingera sp. ANG59]|uniref:NAD(P)H-dependent oxidoreductase n=1 Tax=Leisingera sp. ANG59 TaxID=2675221 RepID=UPI0015721781|nr:NAD(P)H-dependent oxidoreductase [Leisingera sp. ANG59]NSY40355.1 flavodoxin family protein [Leisingera sp. ANG59]
MKTLVYLAHPRPGRSEINAPMFRAAQAIEGVTCVDLYGEYPSFGIDTDREQQRLTEHDAIVFLHPVFWYSAPALLKEWQDLVLEHGFAYGQSGHALDGKVTFNAVTCGAAAEVYTPEGANGAHLRDLLMPFEKTADLCRMRYLAPFVLFGAGRAVDEGRDKSHLAEWQALLQALRDDTLDIAAARAALTLNGIAAAGAAKLEAV